MQDYSRFIFLIGHDGNGARDLMGALNGHPQIQIHETDIHYTYALNLDTVFRLKHKQENALSYWGDLFLNNTRIATNYFYNRCKFIYVIDNGKSLKHMRRQGVEGLRYYTFRLRRICEMVQHTPDALLLLWQDLLDGNGADLIESYLKLRSPLEFSFEEKTPIAEVDRDHLEEAESSFERHYYFLRHQKLQSVRI